MTVPYNQLLKPRLGTSIDKSHRLGPAGGLVLFALANENGGTTVLDASGQEHNGVFGGTTPTWGIGNFGPAISLPGSDEFVNCGDYQSRLSGMAKLTLVADVLTTSITDTPGLICRWGPSSAENTYLMRISGTDLQCFIRTGAQIGGAFFSTWTNNVRHHVVVTWDGTTLRCWLDGILSGTTFSGTGAIQSTSQPTYLGNDTGGSGDPLAGLINTASIYNRDVTNYEAVKLYRKPFCMFKDPNEVALLSGFVTAPVGNAGIMTTNTGYWGPTF